MTLTNTPRFGPSTVLPQYATHIKKPVGRHVHASDTLPDPEAQATIVDRSLLLNSDNVWVPIGHPFDALHSGKYFADFAAQRTALSADSIQRILAAQQSGDAIDPEVLEAQRLQNKTLNTCVANLAPRIVETTNGGANGKDFYLGITDNGTVIFSVPRTHLQYLAERKRLIALYRIPTKGNPVIPEGEQFRSSVITLSRKFPGILIPLFQFETREALLEAIKNEGFRYEDYGIPSQEEPVESSFFDKFGNFRAFSRSFEETEAQIRQHQSVNALNEKNIGVQFGDSPTTIRAFIRRNLSDIPENGGGELLIYHNPADEKSDGCGYYEINVSWLGGDETAANTRLLVQKLFNGNLPRLGYPVRITNSAEAVSAKQVIQS